MMKKVVIGILVLTIIGAGGAALAYRAATAGPETTPDIIRPVSEGPRVNPVQQETVNRAAEGAEGEPWQAAGSIVDVDDYGFTLDVGDGETAYVELGPPDYWQSLGIPVEAGLLVAVEGTINEGMVHAAQVYFAEGQILQIRNEYGQPMWSGGVSETRGQNGGQGDGDQIPDPRAEVDEWVTVSGTLMSFQGGNMTLATPDGALLSFQTGQPRFFAEQAATFQVGEEISVLGFYENDQFMAGEITQIATGVRVMLRDPNGRPLWAGPGNGNGNGNSGGNGNGNGGG
jgi:hypothetical protein